MTDYVSIDNVEDWIPPRNPERVGYAGAHVRARRALVGLPCSSCGSTDDVQVAYQHDRASMLLTHDRPGRYCGLAYSLDPADYAPLCRSCHYEYDRRSA